MLNLNENNIVTPDAETLIIPAFSKIWKSDSSKNKENALKLFAYIYFKHDLKSKYRSSYAGKELDSEIKKDLFENVKYKLPAYVKKAEEIYVNLQMSKSLKMLLAAESSLEHITLYFKDFNLNNIEDIGDKSDLVTKLMRNLKEVDEVTAKIETAKKRIEEELFAQAQSKRRVMTKWEVPE